MKVLWKGSGSPSLGCSERTRMSLPCLLGLPVLPGDFFLSYKLPLWCHSNVAQPWGSCRSPNCWGCPNLCCSASHVVNKRNLFYYLYAPVSGISFFYRNWQRTHATKIQRKLEIIIYSIVVNFFSALSFSSADKHPHASMYVEYIPVQCGHMLHRITAFSQW